MQRKRRRWSARVCVAGRWVYLGLFESEELAARVANDAATLGFIDRDKLRQLATVRERLELLAKLSGRKGGYT